MAASVDGSMRQRMAALVERAQDEICAAVVGLDGGPFREDRWDRPEGGGGVTRVIEDGEVFEKGGVNRAVVFGKLGAAAARTMGGGHRLGEIADDAELDFFAAGVSLVLHPHNPMAPTAHANYRYFEVGSDDDGPSVWWFGGGADLTPAYLVDEDAAHFHRVHRQACDPFDPDYYPRFKAWCDRYFRIEHRGESRGLGGIFFDDLHVGDPDGLLAFCAACADAFVPAYIPLVARSKDARFTPAQKQWQQLRRGRYVEFNLIYDRGTKFGLHSGGRAESVLMSLPLTARWQYDHQPPPDSDEARLLSVLKSPREWA